EAPLALNTRQPTISAARRPHSVGFFTHSGPGAACSASCLASPGSATELSRHLRRTLRRQRHRGKKALSFMCSDCGQGMTLCCSTDVMRNVTYSNALT
ncbi:hypothetical protein CFN58_08425, partial [Pseudomonas avellanae]